jgi:hypothetical protein
VIVLGRGVLKLADGNIYEGEYKDGNRHGKFTSEVRVIVLGRGVWKGADGDNYEGEWKDDKFNGRFRSSGK